MGQLSIAAGSNILTLMRGNGTATFTNSGNKGLGIGTMTYNLS
jgi:hypothetical protein